MGKNKLKLPSPKTIPEESLKFWHHPIEMFFLFKGMIVKPFKALLCINLTLIFLHPILFFYTFVDDANREIVNKFDISYYIYISKLFLKYLFLSVDMLKDILMVQLTFFVGFVGFLLFIIVISYFNDAEEESESQQTKNKKTFMSFMACQ